MKKFLIESAAKVISQQSELSEMGDKPIHNLLVKKYPESNVDHINKQPPKKTVGGLTADQHEKHFYDAMRERDKASKSGNMVDADAAHARAKRHANGERDASGSSFGKLHHVLPKYKPSEEKARKEAKARAMSLHDGDYQKNSFEPEGNSLSEELRTRKLGTHEEEFHTAFDKHLNDLDASNSKSASPEMKNTLRKRSQAHLQIALMSASMHYRKHGSPIKVEGNKYDELISSLRSPLVTKA